MTTEIFQCRELAVERSGQRVLEGVDLSLKPGQIIGLIGPNGCGKTTLLQALAGVIPVAAGSIALGGASLEALPPYARTRLGVRLIPDRNMVFGDLSVEEHLTLRTVDHDPDRLDIRSIAAFRPAQLAGSLSGGEKRILATVSALQARPRLLLADEFSEGLQPSVVQKLLGSVRVLCQQGAMAILVVHSERFAAAEGIPALTIQRRRVVPVE